MKQFSKNNLQSTIFNLQFSIAFLIMLLLPLAAPAQMHEASEYEVKAAFIYNFANFVEWPEGALAPDSTLNICLLGDDPFVKLFDSITGQVMGKRKVVIKRAASLKDIKPCRVLFIASSEKARLKEITGLARANNILTIGDTEGFAKKGLTINLFMDKGKVRFEINPEAAKQAGLRVSPRLLDLARIVREGP